MKSLVYTALVRLILEYGAACWDSFWEGQINVLEWVQKKADKFANLTNDLNWETLAQHRKIARICAVIWLAWVLYVIMCDVYYCIVPYCSVL